MKFDDYQDFNQEDTEHYYEGEPHTYNNRKLGIAIFLLLPIVTLFVAVGCSDMVSEFTFDAVTKVILHSKSPMFIQFFVMSLIPSLIGFFIVYKQERWKLAYGGAAATLIYFALFILKLV